MFLKDKLQWEQCIADSLPALGTFFLLLVALSSFHMKGLTLYFVSCFVLSDCQLFEPCSSLKNKRKGSGSEGEERRGRIGVVEGRETG